VNRDQKSAVVDEVATDIQESEAVFAVDYRGMSVTQAAELRGALIGANAQLRVVKNTLTERAADRAGAEALKALLEGPTALTFVRGDVAAAAKAIADFRRTNELPQFKGGTMGGDPLSVDQIEAIAKLPSRDVLHAQLAGTIASPLTGLVRGLNALISGLAIQLGAIAEQGLIGQDGGPQTADGGGSQTADGGGSQTADGGDETPAAESESEAPGDPVAEAEAAEEETSGNETPSEGETENQEG
jgi:large subunit ribosomal protein L10